MKIITIVGARPQFVKAAVVSRAIAEYNAQTEFGIKEVIVHTGQHYDANMSTVFFDEMQIPTPDYNLDINGLNHGAMTGQMLEHIETVLIDEKPDLVLVYGDTNSTIAGALAAKKLRIKVAHVEAGLRSFNMNMPEEINRILTDRISDILLCPTETAVQNLKREGFDAIDCTVMQCGDVMYDAALFYSALARQPKAITKLTDYILCTTHRAENTDDLERLKGIFDALLNISEQTPVLLPLHPRTRKKLEDLGGRYKEIANNDDNATSGLIVVEPVSYLEMVWLLKNCSFVMTDSGGLQKEAYFFKKPCITLRDETEWVELVDAGVNFLAGADVLKIHEYAEKICRPDTDFPFDTPFYGNGNAGHTIIETLMNR